MDDDKELEAALGELESESTPEADDSAAGNPSSATERAEPTQAEEKSGGTSGPSGEIEVEGRKYKDFEAFKRAHGHLYRDHSRIQNELSALRKQHEPFAKLKDAWDKDPAFYQHLMKAKDEYFARRQAGESPAEAKRHTGLDQVPKEVLERLNRQDQELAIARQEREDRALDTEISDLQRKYKLDDAAVDRCIAKALEVGQQRSIKISLEEAYERLMAIESSGKRLRAETALAQVKGSSAPGSGSAAQPPAPMKGLADYASSADEDKALDGLLDSIGKK